MRSGAGFLTKASPSGLVARARFDRFWSVPVSHSSFVSLVVFLNSSRKLTRLAVAVSTTADRAAVNKLTLQGGSQRGYSRAQQAAMTARPSGAFCSAAFPKPSAMGIMPMIMPSIMSTEANRV